MSNFIKKQSLSEKRHQQYFNPWGLKDVIEAFSGKTYDEVVAREKKKREEKKK